MYKRDLLAAEIQKLAEALARIMGLKKDGKAEEAENRLDDIFEHEYGILYSDLLNCGLSDFEIFLNEKNFTSEKLDLFSQFVYLKFNPKDTTATAISLAEKIKLIYTTLEVKHHIINMINLDRQKTIQQYINLNSL